MRPAPRPDSDQPPASPPLHSRALILDASIAVGALAVLAIWWQDTVPTTLESVGGYFTAAGQVTGLLAAYLLLVLTALMSRVPVFENWIGSDVSARVHRALGEYTVALALCHAVLITLGYAIEDRTNVVTQAVQLELDYPDVLMATASLALLLLVGVTSARAARRKLAYETWHFIHLYVYLAMALAFSHEFADGADFSSSARNRMIWVTAHVAVAALLVVNRLVIPLSRSLRHHLQIDELVSEGPGVVSIYLSGHDLRRLRAEPGQFLRLRFLSRDQWWQSHPYSLSAAPSGDRLRFTVKALGDFSAQTERLRPGTKVWFEGPYGAFTARRAGNRPVLLIAAGAGITPIRALYESISGAGSDVILLYRATRPEDLVLYGELAAIARGRGFGLYPLLGPREGPDPLAPAALKQLVPDVAGRDAYVCGPPGLTASVTRNLRRAGVPGGHIHTELFEL